MNKIKFTNLKAVCDDYGFEFYESRYNCTVVGSMSMNLLSVSPDFLYQIRAYDNFVIVGYEARKALINAAIKDYEIAEKELEDAENNNM